MNSKYLKPYKDEYDYSFTSGAYATIEMLKSYPSVARAIYVHTKYTGKETINTLCQEKGIPIMYDDRIFEKTNQKGNSFVLGVFSKYSTEIRSDCPHIVLVNPSDMGNLGTVIRTMAGLNILDLAVIKPAADIMNPKTVRASMGALFRIRFKCFESFNAYKNEFTEHVCFPFTPEGTISLSSDNCPQAALFSLLFGNEASGLPDECKSAGLGINIPQSKFVDSLNLSIAAGIGMFVFAEKNKLI